MLTTYLLLTIQVNITRFFADSLYLFKSVNCLQNVSLDKKEEGGKRTVNLELNKGSILLVLENIKEKPIVYRKAYRLYGNDKYLLEENL